MVFLVAVVLAATLPGALHAANAHAAPEQLTEYTFERHEVVIDPAARQTVMTGFLLGGDMADLAVVKVTDREERSLRIYTYDDGAWIKLTDTFLDNGVSFVDIARIGNRDRLITYGSGRLSAWDPVSATGKMLVPVTSGFTAPRSGEVPHVDVTRDLNGDGLDELVVPGENGFLVFVQMDEGAFADPVHVGRAVNLDGISGADGYRYDPWSQGRIFELDYDGDGRDDLAYWNGDRFEVHMQEGQATRNGQATRGGQATRSGRNAQGSPGLFDPVPLSFTSDVRFGTDRIGTLAAGEMAGRTLHSLCDLNSDGIADMVIYVLEGDTPSGKRSAYEVHFGSRTSDGGIRFGPDIDVSIETDGHVQLAMDRRDFDGDGELDLVVTTIETEYLESSLYKRIKGFMGDDVWLNLAFYRVEGGRIPDQPGATRRIQLDGAPSPREPGWVPLEVVLQGGKHALRKDRKDREPYARAFNKNLFIGDVTGNGLSDLLIEWTHRELHVYAGIPGPDLFARKPQKVAVELPNDEEYAWLADLNRDGRQDIVMHQPFAERDAHGAPIHSPGIEPHRVTLLIGR